MIMTIACPVVPAPDRHNKVRPAYAYFLVFRRYHTVGMTLSFTYQRVSGGRLTGLIITDRKQRLVHRERKRSCGTPRWGLLLFHLERSCFTRF